MKNYCLFLFVLAIFVGCKSETKKNTTEVSSTTEASHIEYAKGFTIENFEGYKVITLTNAWPGAKKTFRYALSEDKKIFLLLKVLMPS